VVDDAVARLGTALAFLVNALDPGALIVGGGLGLADGYRARALSRMRTEFFDPEARELPVLTAELGPLAAAVGAALVTGARRAG
jgi:predicted NBD/HSP70 family sugar kinase